MKLVATILFLAFLSGAAHAADQWQAREVARLNNCSPKKIEVYQASVGMNGQTTYRVECNVPKMVDPAAKPGPDALLIGCDETLCQMLQPLSAEKK